LRWHEWLWIALPVALVFAGGALGALVGVLATSANTRLMRTERAAVYRYGTSALVSGAAVVVFLVLTILFQVLIHRP
jgi:hypothetical protein